MIFLKLLFELLKRISFSKLELLQYNTCFGKRRHPEETASDGLWVVSFKCVVKSYEECCSDAKEGEDFKVLKKIDKNGLAFRVVNEHGQLGHLQKELVASL